MDATQTIPTQKAAFLRSQIRLLSAILQPSSTWRSTVDAADSPTPSPNSTSSNNDDDGEEEQQREAEAEAEADQREKDIPQRIITTVLTKLNAHLASHNSNAYPPQTRRHIAEQIDRLYWNDVAGNHNSNSNSISIRAGQPESNQTFIPKDLDLSMAEALDQLPEHWTHLSIVPSSSSTQQNHRALAPQAESEQHHHYTSLRARLAFLITEQARHRSRLDAYRRLDGMLQPLAMADADARQVDVDVDVDVELRREVQRMKGLLSRLLRRIGQVGEGGVVGISRDDRRRMQQAETGPDHLRVVMDSLA